MTTTPSNAVYIPTRNKNTGTNVIPLNVLLDAHTREKESDIVTVMYKGRRTFPSMPERILSFIARASSPTSYRALSQALLVPEPSVRRACKTLENEGRLPEGAITLQRRGPAPPADGLSESLRRAVADIVSTLEGSVHEHVEAALRKLIHEDLPAWTLGQPLQQHMEKAIERRLRALMNSILRDFQTR